MSRNPKCHKLALSKKSLPEEKNISMIAISFSSSPTYDVGLVTKFEIGINWLGHREVVLSSATRHWKLIVMIVKVIDCGDWLSCDDFQNQNDRQNAFRKGFQKNPVKILQFMSTNLTGERCSIFLEPFPYLNSFPTQFLMCFWWCPFQRRWVHCMIYTLYIIHCNTTTLWYTSYILHTI